MRNLNLIKPCILISTRASGFKYFFLSIYFLICHSFLLFAVYILKSATFCGCFYRTFLRWHCASECLRICALRRWNISFRCNNCKCSLKFATFYDHFSCMFLWPHCLLHVFGNMRVLRYMNFILISLLQVWPRVKVVDLWFRGHGFESWR